jgi:hypothetical protein
MDACRAGPERSRRLVLAAKWHHAGHARQLPAGRRRWKNVSVFRPGQFLIIQVVIPGRCISRCIQLLHGSALIRA